MKVRECMTCNVATVAQGDTVQHAAQKMRDFRVGFLPVISVGGKAVGVITDRDLATRIVADGYPADKPVWEVMSTHVIHVDENIAVEDAVSLMREKSIGRIVVTNSINQVSGVFSLGDAAIVTGDHVVGSAVMDAVGRHSQAPSTHPPAIA